MRMNALTPNATKTARRMLLGCALMACLSSCTAPPTASPAPAEASALARELCRIWAKTLPTWADGDAPGTIDSVDYAYRVNEATCAPITGQQATPPNGD